MVRPHNVTTHIIFVKWTKVILGRAKSNVSNFRSLNDFLPKIKTRASGTNIPKMVVAAHVMGNSKSYFRVFIE